MVLQLAEEHLEVAEVVLLVEVESEFVVQEGVVLFEVVEVVLQVEEVQIVVVLQEEVVLDEVEEVVLREEVSLFFWLIRKISKCMMFSFCRHI